MWPFRTTPISGVSSTWVPSFRGELTPIFELSARLDEGAAAAGRDPAQIRRILNVGGTITDGVALGPLRGRAAQWADELTDLVVAHGFDTFVPWPDGPD